MSLERRQWPRAEILGELFGRTITLDEPVVIRDLSRGGLNVEMRVPLTLGSRHDFTVMHGDGSIVLSARVSHQRAAFVGDETVYYCGLELVDVTDEGRAFIERILADVPSVAAAG